MNRLILTIAACCVLPALLSGQQRESGRALAVLERAAARYDSLDALCATFEQVIEVTLLEETRHSRGRMCQKPPNLFSMDFTEPAGDRVVADGEALWIYYPSTDENQVFKAELAGGSSLDFHREFLADPGAKYEASYEARERADGRSLHRIAVVPTGPASYERGWVWIADDTHLIHRVILEEENGSVRRVDLSDLDVDPTLDPSTFEFTPPPGAAILQR